MPKLTQRTIKGFTYRGGWDVRWDEGSRGLGVRIYPSGKKAFVLRYRLRRRKHLMALGLYGTDLTLDEARDKARKERAKIREGINPLEEKRSAGRGKTFRDLIEDFMSRHVEAQELKTGRAIRRRLERNIPAAWKSRSADAIEAWEIEALHQEIGKTRPYEANRLLENLRTMYRQAPRWKYIAPSAPNPTDGIKKFKERQRKRWVKPEELPRLAQAIDQEPNIFTRAGLWLLLLTGIRKTELLEARWEDVDWTRGTLRLPETKSGDEQFATLSGPALAVLQSIPRLDNNPHILPGAKPGGHLVNIGRRWRVVREAAKVPDVRLHDLRRTTGSWLSQAGVDLNVIKDALRHRNISTTLIYARLGEDPARAAMEEHGQRIMKAAGKSAPAEVVRLDRTK